MFTVPTGRQTTTYPDGRPAAPLRMDAVDEGVVLKHGDGPDRCDLHGARDLWVYQDNGTFYMNYDGAGPDGWLACLATSRDLVHWEKKGAVLHLGSPGEQDSASASYGVAYHDGGPWHLFYLGTPNTTGPGKIPAFPYNTMKATGPSPAGPWAKQSRVVPFRPKSGTYYDCTASPGQIIKLNDEYRMFFSAASNHPILRTISIARTKDLNGPWTIDPVPIVPPTEQIENSSLYFEPSNQTWFLFTNHVGINDDKLEYTDAIWVYWSKSLDRWNPAEKAVVLDGTNCRWSRSCIGLPGVMKLGDRLAVLYDAPGGDSTDHMNRDLGLAWLKLPLNPPR